MTTKTLTAACTLFALAMSIAAPVHANGECSEGCEPPPPPEEQTKGNNGWGNGPDSTNAGSFSGGTAETKSVNGLGADTFDGKFEGR
jgi:hypothetical protein